MHKLAFIVLTAGLINGCGGGQTTAEDAQSHQKQRCGPQTRCGGPPDDAPPSSSSPSSNGKKDIIVHE